MRKGETVTSCRGFSLSRARSSESGEPIRKRPPGSSTISREPSRTGRGLTGLTAAWTGLGSSKIGVAV